MPEKVSPQELMRNIAIGHWVARLVHIAAKLRLADLLKGGPRTVEDLASASSRRRRGDGSGSRRSLRPCRRTYPALYTLLRL